MKLFSVAQFGITVMCILKWIPAYLCTGCTDTARHKTCSVGGWKRASSDKRRCDWSLCADALRHIYRRAHQWKNGDTGSAVSPSQMSACPSSPLSTGYYRHDTENRPHARGQSLAASSYATPSSTSDGWCDTDSQDTLCIGTGYTSEHAYEKSIYAVNAVNV